MPLSDTACRNLKAHAIDGLYGTMTVRQAFDRDQARHYRTGWASSLSVQGFLR